MIRPISLSSNSPKEIELALNRLIREMESTSKSSIDYSDAPIVTSSGGGEKGEKGEKGDTGPVGPQGVRGQDGPVGPMGLQGETGPSGADGSAAPSFESVSLNLLAYDPTYVYSNDKLATITYDLGGAQSIVKTINYTSGKISSIVLSGDTPNGIDLTKTFTFTNDKLTGVAYS